MPRLFLGFELPAPVKQQLLDIHEPLRGARWQRADQIHLTMRFLGQASDAFIPMIIDSLTDLNTERITLRLHGAGCFGGPQRPFALWAGVAPEQPLVQLREQIDERLAPLALPQDRHAGFKPHITLARIRGGDHSAMQVARRHDGLTSEWFRFDTLALFSSTQASEGSVYSVLHEFPLS
ncbi:RNA 2',3'-cyclic phosphodiesterase [Pseudomonas sp. gcc21]|uniref:RNA 2',3'-cyclic phosphodiesterase n=1 Tax=Pseudomonas sp. gcc21 TaxID=2726989 RepID=UPI0014524623|nr:RNA 2',3'-cyclic phosphodiesterase [Pseudomonas sp. gcc21]QJD60265.1 RNA 2',3'-cyclic phosphodiesterase [Pseudomonas sp. gcc21]